MDEIGCGLMAVALGVVACLLVAVMAAPHTSVVSVASGLLQSERITIPECFVFDSYDIDFAPTGAVVTVRFSKKEEDK